MELSRSNSLTATGEERGEWIEEAEGRLLDELMSRAADLRIAAGPHCQCGSAYAVSLR